MTMRLDERVAPHRRRRVTEPRRATGMKLILVYKFVKAPVMLALALWLTVAPFSAVRSVDRLAHALAEGGVVWVQLSHWLQLHVTRGVMTGGAVLSWLDGVTTALEGILLWTGKPWAEWIVVVGLAALLPVEGYFLATRPGPVKLLVLLVNVVIVAYLVRRRLQRPTSAHSVQ